MSNGADPAVDNASRALLFELQGHHEEAAAAYAEILGKGGPGARRLLAHAGLARIHQSARRHDDAVRELTSAVELVRAAEPERLAPYLGLLGVAHAAAGDPASAIARLEECVEVVSLRQGKLDYLHALGRALLELGDHSRAARSLEAAVDLAAAQAPAWAGLGPTLMTLAEATRAHAPAASAEYAARAAALLGAAHQDLAARLGKDHARSLHLLGDLAAAARAAGDRDGAERAYRDLIEAKERTFGPRAATTVSSRVQLARLWATDRATAPQAEALLQRELALLEDEWPESRRLVASVLGTLADVAARRGDTPTAARLGARADCARVAAERWEDRDRRVVMLVRNTGRFDNRVLKEAKALVGRGYDVIVVALKGDDLPTLEEVDGIRFLRIDDSDRALQRARDDYVSQEHDSRAVYRESVDTFKQRRADVRDAYVSSAHRLRDDYLTAVAGEEGGSSTFSDAWEPHRRRYQERRDARAARYGSNGASEPTTLRSKIKALGGLLVYRAVRAVDRMLYLIAHRSARFAWLVQRRWRRARYLGSRRFTRLRYLAGRYRLDVTRSRRRSGYLVGHRVRRMGWLSKRRLMLGSRDLWYFKDYVDAVLPVLERLQPAVVHAHDLNTLWAATAYKRRSGAAVVYDSHELETHRNIPWTPRKKLVWNTVEALNIRRADAVITVSPGIARFLARKYRIAEPWIVLNSPPLVVEAPQGRTIHELCGVASDVHVYTYVGKVAPGRGVGTLVEALPHLPDTAVFAVLGPRDPEQDEELVKAAERLGVRDRMFLLDPVAPSEVPAATRTAVASVNASLNICKSYDLALPNKLFDTIMAGVPNAVARLAEMADFVTEHEIGVVFDETDPRSVAAAIERLIDETPRGITDEGRLEALQREICWERQVEVLSTVYDRLLAKAR